MFITRLPVVYTHTHTHPHIYIYRERGGGRGVGEERDMGINLTLFKCNTYNISDLVFKIVSRNQEKLAHTIYRNIYLEYFEFPILYSHTHTHTHTHR